MTADVGAVRALGDVARQADVSPRPALTVGGGDGAWRGRDIQIGGRYCMEHLEGRQCVLAALRACQRRFQVILIRHDSHRDKLADVIELAGQRGVPIRYVEAAELDGLAHGATHGGVVAICTAKPRLTPAELLALVDQTGRAPRAHPAETGRAAGTQTDSASRTHPTDDASSARREPALLLLLEGVDDARNLGFTLRSADALGVHAVLIKKHLWDFDAVEVARPASGAYERLPLVQVDDVDLLQQLQRRGVRLTGCVAGAKRTVYEAELTGPVVLAIGGEKRGLSGAVRALCDTFVSIPTRGEAASLALSHAASIVMAEAMRQRRPVPRRPPGEVEDASES